MSVGPEPSLSVFVELVPGAIVDDEEDLLSTVATHELLQKSEETVAVEHVFEPIEEAGIMQCDRAEYVRSSSPAVGIYSGLDPDSGPGLVQCSVEPEARFVFE